MRILLEHWKIPFAVSSISFVVTTLLLIGASEIWLNRAYPKTCVVRHSTLHHVFRPNCTFTEHEEEFSATYTINQFGQRGPNRPREKPNETYRILMIGDSFTEGSGVQDTETFSSIIETSLSDAALRQRHVEIINAGVRKYAPIIEELYLKTEGIYFKPDLVIVNPNVTDLIKTDKFHKSAQFDQRGNLQAIVTPGRHILPLPLRTWLWNHLRVYGYIQERVMPKLYQRYQKIRTYLTQLLKRDQQFSADTSIQYFFSDHSVNMFSLSTDPRVHEKYIELRDLAISNYRSMNAFLKERGIPMLVIIQPLELHVAPHEWEVLNPVFNLPFEFPDDYPIDEQYYKDLKHAFEKEQIPVLDLTVDFRAASDPHGERLFFPFDGHWTAKGHRVAADAMTQFIQEWQTRNSQ